MRHLSVVLGLSLFFQASAFAVTSWEEAKTSPEKMLQHLNEKKEELEVQEQKLAKEYRTLNLGHPSTEEDLARLKEKKKELDDVLMEIAHIKIDIKYVPNDPQEFQRFYAQKPRDEVAGLPGVTKELFTKKILPLLNKENILPVLTTCNEWNNLAEDHAKLLKFIEIGKQHIKNIDQENLPDADFFILAEFLKWSDEFKKLPKDQKRYAFSIIAPLYHQLIAKILNTLKPANVNLTTWNKYRENTLEQIVKAPFLDSETALAIFLAIPETEKLKISNILSNPSVGLAFLNNPMVSDYINRHDWSKEIIAGNPNLRQKKYTQLFDETIQAVQSQDHSTRLKHDLFARLAENPRATETQLETIWNLVKERTNGKENIRYSEEPKIILGLLKNPNFLSYPALKNKVLDFVSKIKVDSLDGNYKSISIQGSHYFGNQDLAREVLLELKKLEN